MRMLIERENLPAIWAGMIVVAGFGKTVVWESVGGEFRDELIESAENQTAEVEAVVFSRAVRWRALRISIARWSNCSNSQRSILGPRREAIIEFCSSV